MKNKLIAICLLLIATILAITNACSHEDKVLAYVNEEPIYAEDINDAIERCLPEIISLDEAIDSAISELLVLQQAETLGITVSDEEIDSLLNDLQQHTPELYQIAIRQYDTIDRYKVSLYRLVKYNKVKDHITQCYLDSTPLHNDEIISLLVNRGLISEEDNDILNENVKQFYVNEYNQYRSEEFFGKWVAGLRESATVVVLS